MDADRRTLERRLAANSEDGAALEAYDRALERAGEMGPRRSLLQAFAGALDALHSRLVGHVRAGRIRYWYMVDRDVIGPPNAQPWQGPFRTNYSPIRPGSFYLFHAIDGRADELIGQDNRMGVITGVGVLGTIDYTTGQLRFTMLPESPWPLAATYEAARFARTSSATLSG